VFDHFQFFITSRPGDVFKSFLEHLAVGGQKPQEFDLTPMDSDEIVSLCRLNGLDPSKNTIKGLICATDGNPLYLRALLSRIQQDPELDLNHLPSEVVDFFRGDLKRRFRIEQDDFLKKLLSLFLVLRERPNASQLADILKIGRREMVKRLYQLSGYLVFDSISETYAPFHIKFSESLTWGIDPILYPEDIIDAHRAVIAWCEPIEDFHYSEIGEKPGTRSYYALNYLCFHYWTIGIEESYQGFMGLLGRNNVTCEIACRIFLKDLVASQKDGRLLDDSDFRITFKNMFWNGNDAARHALLRFSTDIIGYIHSDQIKSLWEEIIITYFPHPIAESANI
jgi:hypothetical protein